MAGQNSKSLSISKPNIPLKKKLSLSTLMLLPEYKREVFKKYMDKSGMMDIMAKAMIALKNRSETTGPEAQPEDTGKFIKDMMLSEIPINNEIEEVRSLIAAATERLNMLLAENEMLKAQLEAIELSELTQAQSIVPSSDKLTSDTEEGLANPMQPTSSDNNYDNFELSDEIANYFPGEKGSKSIVGEGEEEEGVEETVQNPAELEEKQPSASPSLKDNSSKSLEKPS